MPAPSVNTIDINSFRAAFLNTYQGSVNGLWFNDVAKVYPIQSIIGVYPGLAQASGMKAWTGDRMKKKPLPFKLSMTSAPYESSVTYPVPNFTVDSAGIFGDNVANLADKAAWHYNTMVKDFLLVGHSTESFDSKWDGITTIYYFSATHPISFDDAGTASSASQSNLYSGGTADTTTLLKVLAVADKAAPTQAECADIITTITGKFLAMKDLAGDPINADCRNIDIFVGDEKKYTAFVAATSTTVIVSGTTGTVASNPVVGFQKDGFKYRIVLEPGLSGDAIFALRADGRVKPIVIQESQGIQIQTLGPDSEYAKVNNYVLFGASKTCAIGPLLYTSALKLTLTTKT